MFGEFKLLEDAINRGTKGFYHSTPVMFYPGKDGDADMELGLREFLLIAMVSGNNLLVTGDTGIGKTRFIDGALRSVFGESYAFLQIDPSLDMGKLIDMDFSVITNGKKLSDGMSSTKYITSGAILLDEYNRAPAQLSNILQGWLTNGEVISLGGSRFSVGIDVSDVEGSTLKYQFKVATINEGNAFGGTFNMDRAARDRFPLVLDFDIFHKSEDDLRNIMRSGAYNNNNTISESERVKIFEALQKIYKSVRNIPIDETSEHFMVHLDRLDNCYKSPEGTKKTLESFDPDTCSGCKAIKEDTEICGNIRAPSTRTVINLRNSAKAFAAYRSYLKNEEPIVTIRDVFAVAPFILNTESLGVTQGWVAKYGEGSKRNASNTALKLVALRLIRGKNEVQKIAGSNKPAISDKKIYSLAVINPWCVPEIEMKKLHDVVKSTVSKSI